MSEMTNYQVIDIVRELKRVASAHERIATAEERKATAAERQASAREKLVEIYGKLVMPREETATDEDALRARIKALQALREADHAE